MKSIKLNKEDREALEDSIKHWAINIEAESWRDAGITPSDCALCGIYYSRNSDDTCIGCPVMRVTGKPYCRRSPYDDAHSAYCAWKGGSEMNRHSRNVFVNAAKLEHEFLVDILINSKEKK